MKTSFLKKFRCQWEASREWKVEDTKEMASSENGMKTQSWLLDVMAIFKWFQPEENFSLKT